MIFTHFQEEGVQQRRSLLAAEINKCLTFPMGMHLYVVSCPLGLLIPCGAGLAGKITNGVVFHIHKR
jgi:hypothetical protein